MLMFLAFRLNRKLTMLFITALIIILAVCTGASNPAKATDFKSGVKLPVIMYHSLLKDKKYQGKYVISPDTFESDLQYLQKNGYTTINTQDLINYVDYKIPLPSKPVLLTFDDGYYNNYLYAYPLAKKYNAEIMISPIGYCTDFFTEKDANHANYSHCTWDEIIEMMSSGLVEFQNHTYNLHSGKGSRIGVRKRKGENIADYEDVLSSDLNKMQEEMQEYTGYTPTTFVYPYGEVSRESIPIIKSMGFKVSMTCQYKMNYITEDPDCLYGLGRYLRSSGSSEKFFKKIGMI